MSNLWEPLFINNATTVSNTTGFLGPYSTVMSQFSDSFISAVACINRVGSVTIVTRPVNFTYGDSFSYYGYSDYTTNHSLQLYEPDQLYTDNNINGLYT